MKLHIENSIVIENNGRKTTLGEGEYEFDSASEFIKFIEGFGEQSKEPLIKDEKHPERAEKARRALKMWAECCHVQVVHHYLSDGNSCFMFTDEDGNDCCLDFTFRIDNLESNTDYTIAELCGEEEE